VALVPVPAVFVTLIFPVVAPVGTVALICVSEVTVNVVAPVPLKLTPLAPVKPVPVSVTLVPTGPLVGVNELITGAVVTVPVAVRLTDCGLPPPSSLNSSDALRLPVAAGLKVMPTVQLAPPPKVLPHVVVSEKSLAFAPRIAISHMFIAALLLFVKATTCTALLVPTAWGPKVRLVGDGPAADPTPVRIIGGEFPLAPEEPTTMEDFRGPAVVGVKVALIAQFAPAATEVPQVLVWAKSLAFAPVTAMPVMLKLVFPVFVRVTVWAALVIATD